MAILNGPWKVSLEESHLDHAMELKIICGDKTICVFNDCSDTDVYNARVLVASVNACRDMSLNLLEACCEKEGQKEAEARVSLHPVFISGVLDPST